MVASTDRTPFPLGTRPAGSPVGSVLSNPAILCLGDSITRGQGDPGGNGYRGNLHDMLVAAGLSPTWIGPQTDGDAPHASHRGVSGRTTVDHLADINTVIGGGGSYHPTLILVFLGTNDALDGTLTTNWATNFEALLNECHTLEATARFVAVLLPVGGDATRRANIVTINGVTPTSVSTLASGGLLIATADCRVIAAADNAQLDDGLHPNPAGYLALADALYPAVMNACGYDAEW